MTRRRAYLNHSKLPGATLTAAMALLDKTDKTDGFPEIDRAIQAWHASSSWGPWTFRIPLIGYFLFNLRRVSLTKKPSTAFSHALDVGMKWKVQPG